jgi:DNA polymerase-3 subunit gamma/tau
MIGQPVVTKDFKARSKDLSFPQVMLLEGPTGSGKTTSALIIAQLLNCLSPVKQPDGTLKACQECPSCKDILAEKYGRDIKIFDCSDMNKDDILALKDKFTIKPMYDKNKIFILDEAQNLGSAKSKGALLLLLEKKYNNCYIIMNTMDVSKFDRAITSRAQSYKFKAITENEMSDFLFKVAEKNENKENPFPDSFFESMTILAEYSKGSVREALQFLERCINGELYTKQAMLVELGFLDQETVYSLLVLLLKKSPSFFTEYRKLASTNKEAFFDTFFNMTWASLVNVLLFRKDPDFAESEFMANTYSFYSKYDTLQDLLALYTKVFSMSKGYMNGNLFFSVLLTDYFPLEGKVMPSLPKRPVKTDNKS